MTRPPPPLPPPAISGALPPLALHAHMRADWIGGVRECARGHSGQPGTPSWVQSRKPTTPVTWWLLSNRQAWGQPLGPPVPPPPGNSPTPSSCWGHPLSRDYPTAPHNPFPACRKTSLKGKPDHVPALGRGARILTGAEQTLSGLASLLPRSSEGTSLASPTTHTHPPTRRAVPTFFPCLRHAWSWASALGSSGGSRPGLSVCVPSLDGHAHPHRSGTSTCWSREPGPKRAPILTFPESPPSRIPVPWPSEATSSPKSSSGSGLPNAEGPPPASGEG